MHRQDPPLHCRKISPPAPSRRADSLTATQQAENTEFPAPPTPRTVPKAPGAQGGEKTGPGTLPGSSLRGHSPGGPGWQCQLRPGGTSSPRAQRPWHNRCHRGWTEVAAGARGSERDPGARLRTLSPDVRGDKGGGAPNTRPTLLLDASGLFWTWELGEPFGCFPAECLHHFKQLRPLMGPFQWNLRIDPKIKLSEWTKGLEQWLGLEVLGLKSGWWCPAGAPGLRVNGIPGRPLPVHRPACMLEPSGGWTLSFMATGLVLGVCPQKSGLSPDSSSLLVPFTVGVRLTSYQCPGSWITSPQIHSQGKSHPLP